MPKMETHYATIVCAPGYLFILFNLLPKYFGRFICTASLFTQSKDNNRRKTRPLESDPLSLECSLDI